MHNTLQVLLTHFWCSKRLWKGNNTIINTTTSNLHGWFHSSFKTHLTWNSWLTKLNCSCSKQMILVWKPYSGHKSRNPYNIYPTQKLWNYTRLIVQIFSCAAPAAVMWKHMSIIIIITQATTMRSKIVPLLYKSFENAIELASYPAIHKHDVKALL